jgi:DNA-binding CsgD family transcriptional regulator
MSGSRRKRQSAPRGLRGAWIADSELVVLSLPLPEADSAALELLTRAEREVARLVLRGYSNAEIAARRDVSRATVQTQLEAIYRKLGVASRGELCALSRAGKAPRTRG